MPRPAKGTIRWSEGVPVARIRVTADLRASFKMPHCDTEQAALERSELLARLAQRLRAARIGADEAQRLLDVVASATARALPSTLQVLEGVVGGELQRTGASRVPTFQEIGEQWTSGELTKRYRDHIKAKRSASDDVARLTRHVYPVIGSRRIDRLTVDDCEEVMRRLPGHLENATRRNVGQLITRILTMSVYPLRLIQASPIPKGFLPSASKPKGLAHLYPSEDARLMACTAVPVEYRLLWGFLSREGMRLGEVLELRWHNLDLTRGAVRLERNKTDDVRMWALNRGTAAALRQYRDLYRSEAEPGDRVFLDPQGRPIVGSGALGMPAMLRDHLRAIGLEKERPELFTSTPERRRIRVHDLRGTFVTVSLANGKSEAWIADRTGHKSSEMINRYKRVARTFAELSEGDMAPLSEAIPELAGVAPGLPYGPGLVPGIDISAENVVSPAGFEPASSP